MAEETTTDAPPAAPPAMTIATAPQTVCEQLGVAGALVITRAEDGTMMLLGHGVNHHAANEMLSRAMQVNLNQHDELVRQGLAGALAQAKQLMLDGEQVGGVQ